MMSGGARPPYDDLNLILKLYGLRREDRLREARRWFATSFKVKTLEEFNGLCPAGSEPNASYRMVTGYWEMVASFVTSGVLHQELLFQSARELLFTWERVRDVLPHIREMSQNPVELKNLEVVARGYIDWWFKQSPGAYDAFSNRVRGS